MKGLRKSSGSRGSNFLGGLVLMPSLRSPKGLESQKVLKAREVWPSGAHSPFRTTLGRSIHLAHTTRRFKCTTTYKLLRTYCPNRFTVFGSTGRFGRTGRSKRTVESRIFARFSRFSSPMSSTKSTKC